MNRKPTVCLNDLLNQKPLRKSKLDQNSMIPQIISEKSFSHQIQHKKKQKLSKLLTSDYSNSINKIEFARQIENNKTENKKYHLLRDAIKLIHEKFIKSLSKQNNFQKQIVPQFIRQRDQQKREMQKIILNNNSQLQDAWKGKINYQVILIELILLISIIYMWSQMIGRFGNK